MRLRILLVLSVLAGLAVACGVPRTSKFTSIDPPNIPPILTETTTTTTQPSTTTTVQAEGTTTTALATTTTVVETAPVTLYFVIGGQLSGVSQLLARPVSYEQAYAQTLHALENGPQGDATPGFRSAIPLGSESRVTVSKGVATIDLDPNFNDGMDPKEFRLAIAQIVLTMTEQNGVGAVRFTQNGQDVSVILADGTRSEAGVTLYHEDYALLLSSAPATTTTTLPETTTTTLAPDGATTTQTP